MHQLSDFISKAPPLEKMTSALSSPNDVSASGLYNKDIQYNTFSNLQQAGHSLNQEPNLKSPASDGASRPSSDMTSSAVQRAHGSNLPEQQLISAIYKHNYDDALRLVRENTYYDSAGSILSVACYVNDHRMIELLLQQPNFRAHINRHIQGHALLHKATVKGDAKLARLLIRYGADPNLQNEYGQSALHLAALSHNHELHAVLLNATAPSRPLDSSYLTGTGTNLGASSRLSKSGKFSDIEHNEETDRISNLNSPKKQNEDFDNEHGNMANSNNNMQTVSQINQNQQQVPLSPGQQSALDISRLNQLANLQAERDELLNKIQATQHTNNELRAALELSKARDNQNELRHEEARQQYAEAVQKYNELLSQYESRLKDAGRRHAVQQQELQSVCNDLRQKYNNALLQADQLSKQLRNLQELQMQNSHSLETAQTVQKQSPDLNVSHKSTIQGKESQNDVISVENSTTNKVQELQKQLQTANITIKQLQDEKSQLQTQVNSQKIKNEQQAQDIRQKDIISQNLNDEHLKTLKNENDELRKVNIALADERDQLLVQIQQLFEQNKKGPQIQQTICSCGFVIILLTTIIIIGAAMLSNTRLNFGFEKLDLGTDQAI